MNINFTDEVVADRVSIGKKRSRGLGAAELFVSLALAGLLAGIAAPVYQDSIEKHRLLNGARQISLFINSVKAHAVQHSRHASVSYKVLNDGAWCLGATFDRSPCNCMETDPAEPAFCRLDATRSILRDADVPAENLLQATTGDGDFTFDSVRGIFVDPRDSMMFALQSKSQTYRLQLRLGPTGTVSLCEAPGSKDLSRYKPCE